MGIEILPHDLIKPAMPTINQMALRRVLGWLQWIFILIIPLYKFRVSWVVNQSIP
jgi:hypothetical protein